MTIQWSPRFSRKSIDRLKTCRPELQRLMNRAMDTLAEAIPGEDMTILEGRRSIEQQRENVRKGVSKTLHSRHCDNPSRAVDVAPFPVDWKNLDRFELLALHIKRCAKELGIKVEWGGDWKTFADMPHWQVD